MPQSLLHRPLQAALGRGGTEHLDDLGGDGHGDLRRGLGADVQAHRRVDKVDVRLGEAVLAQALGGVCHLGPAADHTQIARTLFQKSGQAGVVVLVAPGHNDKVGARGKRALRQCGEGGADQFLHCGEPLRRHEFGPVVLNGDGPLHGVEQGRQSRADMATAAEKCAGAAHQSLLIPARMQAGDLLSGGRVDGQRSLPLPVQLLQQAEIKAVIFLTHRLFFPLGRYWPSGTSVSRRPWSTTWRPRSHTWLIPPEVTKPS